MKIGFGVGTMALVMLAGCGPVGVDLGGDRDPSEPGRGGTDAVGGSGGYGNSGAFGGTSAGGTSAGGSSAGGSSAGGSGGTPICEDERIQTVECYPAPLFNQIGEETCAIDGRRMAGILYEVCSESEGTANGATILCCSEDGAGGTGAGGTAGVGGAIPGGSSAGGSSAGGAPAGGSSAGGSPAGGSSAGDAPGGSSAGGTSAGGSSAGYGGTIPTGGTGAAPGEECWRTTVDAEGCADNDVFLGRGYERCERGYGRLSSIEYTAICDAYTSRSADVTCCASRGTDGTAGTDAGGTSAGGTRAN